MPVTTKKQIYVFDSGLPDLQVLIDAAGPDAQIILLDSASDGILQLAKALQFEIDIDALHIFSHGSVGSLELGSTVLSLATLPDYSEALAQIGQALTAEGDLLLYGCDVAQGEVGQAFIAQLAGDDRGGCGGVDGFDGGSVIGRRLAAGESDWRNRINDLDWCHHQCRLCTHARYRCSLGRKPTHAANGALCQGGVLSA